jgi:hypothetical protein
MEGAEMPVLHRYRKRNMYYVFTEIKGKVITFQLTGEGERKIRSAHILPGKTFGRALLLELYRSGDAFTSGKGLDQIEQEIEPRQLEFDFSKDPEPESLFPLCGLCSSPEDLHLVEIRDGKHYASILCPDCRGQKKGSIDSSIPLPLVTPSVLGRFLEMKHIERQDPSVENYQALLNAEFKNTPESPKKRKKTGQRKLFDLGTRKEETSPQEDG